MLFNKHKKQQELQRQRELEQQKLEQERIRREQQLRLEREAAEAKLREEAKKVPPYKFSAPDPAPKELISVLKAMLKKLFPEAKKAYLVFTQYEEKQGYLLVVDIDAKFLKIINIYLDGETKMVRNGLPIECILYSKSGSLTDGMEPFYQKAGLDAANVPMPELNISSSSDEITFADMPEFEMRADVSEPETEVEPEAEPETETEVEPEAEPETETEVETEVEVDTETEVETEVEVDTETEVETEVEVETESEVETDAEPETESEVETEVEVETETEVETEAEPEVEPEPETEQESNDDGVKVKPETKQQLFALMNRAASNDSEEVQRIAYAGFGEFEFYIPYKSDENADSDVEKIDSAFPPQARLVLLINRDNGIKAVAFFTDSENALSFARDKGCRVARIKYKDYKNALSEGEITAPAAEGLIINPDAEQILLPPDYPLL